MVSSVYWEWNLLLSAVKLGVRLTFVYDGICIFRIMIPHKKVLVSVQDFLFWVYAAVLIFQFQLELSDGVLRGFAVLGMLLGMYLYTKLLGERILLLAKKADRFWKRQLTKNLKMFKMKK